MMSISKSSLHRIGAVRVVRSSVERVLVRREIRVVWARARRAGSAETLGSTSQPDVVRLKRKIKTEIKEEFFFEIRKQGVSRILERALLLSLFT